MKFAIAFVATLVILCESVEVFCANSTIKFENVIINDKVLDISHQNFTSLESVQLSENLEEFYASHNNIADIPEDLFSKASKLSKIDLSNNEISEISNDALKNLKQLNVLNLNNNSITSVDSSAFDFKSSYTISLEFNPIKKFDCSLLSFVKEKHIKMYISWAHVEQIDLRCNHSIEYKSDKAQDEWLHDDGRKFQLQFNEKNCDKFRNFTNLCKPNSNTISMATETTVTSRATKGFVYTTEIPIEDTSSSNNSTEFPNLSESSSDSTTYETTGT